MKGGTMETATTFVLSHDQNGPRALADEPHRLWREQRQLTG